MPSAFLHPMNSHYIRDLFAESSFGGLPALPPWGRPGRSSVSGQTVHAATAPLSLVETLGFPRGTSPTLLARILEDIRATPPGSRVDRLRSPGVLSPLFSQSAAEASYALAILAVVESRDFETTLARLRAS